jgi:hypothetical protein
MPKLPNHDVYVLTNTLPLSLEFQFRCACLLYVIVGVGGVPNLRDIFVRKVATGPTRGSDDKLRLVIPLPKAERERMAFSWWGCLLWHCIPPWKFVEQTIRAISDSNICSIYYGSLSIV